MAKNTMSGIKALRAAIKENPFDLTRRLVLADALEEEGGTSDAVFQRLLVQFMNMVQTSIDASRNGGTNARIVVGATDGPVNTRVYTSPPPSRASVTLAGWSLYCWVGRFVTAPGDAMFCLGPVQRGSWHRPAGPVRFYLAQGDATWKLHISAYGLAYMK